MRTTRTLTAALLALAVLLAACSGADEAAPADAEPAGAEPAEPADDADTEAAAAEPSADGVTEVPVWIAFTDYRLDWMVDVAAAFGERHPEYEIAVQGYDSYESLFQATQLAAQQGAPPAVVQYFEVATQEARDAAKPDGTPLFAPIEDRIAGRDEILGEPVVIDDIVDAVTSYYTVDGTFTSMPWNSSSTLLYANGTMLAEAGAEVPTTWAELEEACAALREAEVITDGCITWPNHGWFFEQSVGQQGGLLADNDNGRSGRATEVTLDDPAMLSFVGWWAGLAEQGDYVYTGTQRDWDGTQNAFIAQQLPFILTSSGDATAIVTDGTEAGFDVEVARMPHNGDVAYDGNLIGGATLWLVDGLDEVVEEGALAFLQFLNNPENAADWHKATGYIPITNGAVALLEDEGWFDENPHARVATDQLDAASGSPASTGALLGSFVAIRDVVTQAMEDVLVSGADPVERFTEADAEAQQLLDEYNALYAR
jgi:sn-glycerol 3-phosphate transport system substrate-binding protein